MTLHYLFNTGLYLSNGKIIPTLATIRNAYDSNTGEVSCIVARFNDPLDSSLDNSEFYLHPLRPNLLSVRATNNIKDGDFGYIPYGAYFWCNSK